MWIPLTATLIKSKMQCSGRPITNTMYASRTTENHERSQIMKHSKTKTNLTRTGKKKSDRNTVRRDEDFGVASDTLRACMLDLGLWQSAERIAKAITRLGGDRFATRIALKSGKWPDDEREEGGLCYAALESTILHELRQIVSG